MSKRFNLINIVVGRRGSGKTFFTKMLFRIFLGRGMKVLIVDTFNHPSYNEGDEAYPSAVQRVMPHQVPSWKKGIYRMYGHDFDTEMLPALKDLRNTFIVFEDAKKYIRQHVQPELDSLLIDSKQKNIDMIFLYHSWGDVPPRLIKMADSIEVFRTADSPQIRKNLISGIFVEAMKVYEKVKSSKKDWFHQSIDMRN